MKQDFTSFLSYKPEVQAFFDLHTNTISYVVADTSTGTCVIIDSVLYYDPQSGTLSYKPADAIVHYIHSKNYTVVLILETHVHADHLTAAWYLKEKVGGKIAMSKHIVEIQNIFGDTFYSADEFKRDGSQFDHLFNDEESFMVGDIPAYALHTPGHTPADMVYIIGDAVFAGDTLFMPDYGTARCDFPGGSADEMYASVQKIYSLPEAMRMFTCHDYLPNGRTEYIWETTVGKQKRENIHIHANMDPDHFINMRMLKDATLDMPRLLIPSIQVNIRGGELLKNPKTGAVHLTTPRNDIFDKKK